MRNSKEEKWEMKIKPLFLKKYYPPRIIQDIAKYNNSSKGINSSIFLWGKGGNGKTIRACSLLLNQRKIDFFNNELNTYFFVNVSDLKLQLQEAIKTNTVLEVLEFYKNITYLILDDLGVSKNSEWFYEMLYVLINYRYEYLKNTVFTCNFSIEVLSELLQDTRIPGRILQSCGNEIYKIKDYKYRGI